ncbi:hypothetical protein DICA4_E06876 [Diutina catenulata]
MNFQFIAFVCSILMVAVAAPASSNDHWAKNDDGLYKYPHFDTTWCDGSHAPTEGSCEKLIAKLKTKKGRMPLQPRSYCDFGCCVSWSEPMWKSWEEIVPHFEPIDWICARNGFSGQQTNGKWKLCMSNRPNGCKPIGE